MKASPWKAEARQFVATEGKAAKEGDAPQEAGAKPAANTPEKAEVCGEPHSLLHP